MKTTTIEEGVANWEKMQQRAAAVESNDSALAKRARRYEYSLAKRQQSIFKCDYNQ